MKNNGIVIKDSEQFREVIMSLRESRQKVKEIFEREMKTSEEVNGEGIWTGSAQKSMGGKMSALAQNYGPIISSLEIYDKFLTKTLEDYIRVEEEISKNIEMLAEKMDVNS
jgi:hypothetical protein